MYYTVNKYKYSTLKCTINGKIIKIPSKKFHDVRQNESVLVKIIFFD